MKKGVNLFLRQKKTNMSKMPNIASTYILMSSKSQIIKSSSQLSLNLRNNATQ